MPEVTDKAARTTGTPLARRSRRRQAAAARHSRAYRERQKAKGMPTGPDIDAMIGTLLVRLACRPNGLRTNEEQLPKLCEVVANRFSVADELRGELVRRVAARVERMRAVS